MLSLTAAQANAVDVIAAVADGAMFADFYARVVMATGVTEIWR